MQLLVDLTGSGLRDFGLDGSPRHHIASGLALQGPRTRPILIDGSSQRMACGVSFFPGGVAPFFPVPAFEMIDRLVDLRDIWGQGVQSLVGRLADAGTVEARFRILEAALLEKFRPSGIDQRRLYIVNSRIQEQRSIGSIEEELSMHARGFIAWFRHHIGPRPKHYARLARFQELLSLSEQPDSWGGRALAAGFTDQAHMNREFQHFARMRPTKYRSMGSMALNHVDAASVRNIQDR
jgi:AraC-like DNA-binding protein